MLLTISLTISGLETVTSTLEGFTLMYKNIQLSTVVKISSIRSIAALEANMVQQIYAVYGRRRCLFDFVASCLIIPFSDLLAVRVILNLRVPSQNRGRYASHMYVCTMCCYKIRLSMTILNAVPHVAMPRSSLIIFTTLSRAITLSPFPISWSTPSNPIICEPTISVVTDAYTRYPLLF